MAEQAADEVCAKLGVTAECTTADEVLPDQGDGRTYWLGHRLAEHEASGGGNADLVCECEMLTRSAIEQFLDERWPCSLDDVRRGTRLGMGPCQGGFCTFRAAGLVAERGIRAAAAGAGSSAAAAASAERPTDVVAADGPTASDRVLVDFLAERYRGMRPIAWGRQLQELWLTAGLYSGVLGIGSLVEADRESGTNRVAASGAPAPVAASTLTRETDGDHAAS
jgi:glycerol-3-phosphate dehydrogenase